MSARLVSSRTISPGSARPLRQNARVLEFLYLGCALLLGALLAALTVGGASLGLK